MNILNQIFDLFLKQGGSAYIGEPITQLEHAIQTALAARRNAACHSLVTAALLHDIGHFMHSYDSDCADFNIDSQHELIGESFLRKYFKNEVAELVKHHVNAKRYLTAVDEKYFSNLSNASLKSLHLQGGPMSKNEIIEFRNHPLFTDILLLRRWDEGAKIPHKKLPPITDFSKELTMSLR